jgi:hypothetical protein
MNKHVSKVLIIAGILVGILTASTGLSATYYVDAARGDDKNNGLTQTSAWKTIAKVNTSRFQPGDQILFNRGEIWRETLLVPTSGTPGKPIVFGAYGSVNKPTIVGSDAVTSWKNIGGNVWNAIVTTEPKVVWFNGTAGTKKASKSKLVSSDDWCWAGNTLSVYSAITPSNIEAASRTNSASANGKGYLKFSNLNFVNGGNGSGGGTLVLGSGSSEIEVASCDFFQANTCHIGIWGTASGTYKIFNSSFGYSGLGHFIGAGNAIDVTTITNPLVIVEKNTFTHVGDWAGSGYHDHGIYFKGGRLIWRYNYQHNGGVETGASVKISSWKSGSAQDGCEIYYNIFSAGDGAQSWGVLSEAGSGHKIYNNVFYGVGTGVWQSGPNGSYVAGGSGITVKNNIFHTTSHRFIKATATTNLISDYNLFYNGPTAPLQWGNSTYSVPDWKTTTRQDTHSMTINPDFVEPSQGNFTLQPSSPCIDAGTDVGLKRDFNNVPVPQRNGLDIGTFEYKKEN